MEEEAKEAAGAVRAGRRTKEESFFRDIFSPETEFYARIKADARAAGMSMKAMANIWLADAWAMRSPATEELVAVMKGRPSGGWFSSASLARMRAKEMMLEAENRRLKRENDFLRVREEEELFKDIGFFPEDGDGQR